MNLKEALTKIANARADALAMIESNGFVFTRSPRPPELATSEEERWEGLAFTLYTRLGVVSATAEEALATLDSEFKVDDAEWQRRHS